MKPYKKKIETLVGVKCTLSEYFDVILRNQSFPLSLPNEQEWYHNDEDTFTVKLKGKIIDPKDVELIIEEKQ